MTPYNVNQMSAYLKVVWIFKGAYENELII